MKPCLYPILLSLCLHATMVSAQIRFLEIVPASGIVPQSLYNTIEFLNSKTDSNFLGIVGTGLMKNNDAPMFFHKPLEPQLSRLLHSLIDNSAAGGTLLLQIKALGFAETAEARYCYMDLALYRKSGSQYQLLAKVNTTDIVTSSNVTLAVNNSFNDLISKFIASNLRTLPYDTTQYTLGELSTIDSFEKIKIPLYNVDTFVEGIYSTFAAFKQMTPDKQGTIEVKKDGSIKRVEVTYPSGYNVKVQPKDLYAFVYHGIPYIATEYGYYQLHKVADNFIFVGDVRIVPSNGDLAGAQFAFGALGVLRERAGARVTYLLQIDHQNGQFVHLKKMPRDPDSN
jgi:hypothetical protein